MNRLMLSVEDGKILACWSGLAEAEDTTRHEATPEGADEIVQLMRDRAGGKTGYRFSSSMDHPQEYGVPEGVDPHELIKGAVERAQAVDLLANRAKDETLPRSGTEIERRPGREDHLEVVLARLQKGVGQYEFVVWTHSLDDDGYFGGFYTDDLQKAVEEYVTR